MKKIDWANLAICAAQRSAIARRRSWNIWNLPRGEWRRLVELSEAESETSQMAVRRWASMHTLPI